MKQNAVVPAFLSKLWTLCEDEENNTFICWSQEGNSFLVLDEQRFAKDILPKFFKHNNMASFIRQLNMYGFRKVMHMDTGMVKQERDGPVEFQHPYFKHGQDELLQHIKRKVSSTRPPEDRQLRQEDLSRLLSSVQTVHGKQEAVDAGLTAMKRENEVLWREMSDLRQKHAHQQQLIKKLIHFIVTLVQNNHILNLKRKRPILMNSNGKKPKYIHQIYEEQSAVNSLNGVKGAEITDDVIICDVTQGEEPGGDVTDDITESTLRVLDEGDVEVVEVEAADLQAADLADLQAHNMDGTERRALEPSSSLQINKPSSSSLQINKPSSSSLQINKPSSSSLQINKPSSSSLQINKPSSSSLQINKPSSSSLQINKPSSSSLQINKPSSSSLQINKPSSSSLQINKPSSSSLQINKPSGGLSAEDPFKMMDSIMNDSNAAISQNINLLGKVELMDYLDSIDCSLEDFQAMLFCKHFTDEDFVVHKDCSEQLIRDTLETEHNTDKQLIQYTQCPLLAFLDSSGMEQQASSIAPSTDLLLNSSIAPPTDLLLNSSIAPPTDLLLNSSTAPPTDLLLNSSTAPPTDLLLNSSIAPPTDLLLNSSIAPPTDLLLHSSTAPPTDLLLHSSTAPPTDLLLNSSIAPPTDLLLNSSIAPPTDLLLHSSTAPPTDLLLHSSTAPPTDLLLHSSTAPPTDLLLHSSIAPPTDLLLHSSYYSTAPPTDLLEERQEQRAPRSSSLVRLEPLTEAEASEETLFYLCELSPQRPLEDTV